MTMLTYTLITDPAPLEASAAGRPSTGTVYLVITNTGQQTAYWSTVKVEVHVGNGAGDLTSDFNKIKTKGKYGTRAGTRSSVNVQRQGSNAFLATAPGGTAPYGTAPLAPGDYMVLTLENVTVAATAGLAVLTVTENTSRTKTAKPSNSFAAVALVKTAPKELPPRDFRPDKAMVDAGEKLTLSWQGSAGFRYEIMYPGAPQPVPVSGGSWSPPAPKRATTYILIATDPNTQQQHFLTTTVQVRNPVLETLTATTGIDTPRVGGPNGGDGAVAFSQGGVTVWRARDSNDPGTLHAGEVVFDGVATGYVKGLKAGDGDIDFLPGGVKVWSTRGSSYPGTLDASEVVVNVVATKYVKGRNSDDGYIGFLPGGVKVWRTSAINDPGTLHAGEAEFNGVATEYVKGLNPTDGALTFVWAGAKVLASPGSPYSGVLHAARFQNEPQ
ncbi:hypothetical protein IMZ11_21490 [Microtetraspora sp. AC03309]|uniref:hypothetical protein n=1 Tax=Microtetraspora sp. AC03309 TaxID=2779376 RepID=UPI001E62FF9A|nr:hypothetical protein [Microtetraspora sp. AC03309]MCC5578203.1 hypothetical protein [Microtetraspora sp. AC03309]